MKHPLVLTISAQLMAVCAFGTSSSNAQSTSGSSLLEEVIVTARKTEEALIDVPVAVSVLGEQFFDSSGFNTIEEVVRFVPGFDYSATNTTRAQGARIRGISTFSFSDGFESSVATVIDGVVMGREAQGFFDLYDVQSMEVIKGPQGTLFGKNASAGVVSITTKAPEFEFGGGVDVMVGSFGELRTRGSVTGPLIDDKLAFRLTGSRHEHDGKLDNTLLGEPDINDKDTWSMRGKLLFTPTDALSATLILDTVREDASCCMPTYRIAGDPSVVFALAQNEGVLQLQDALTAAGITPGVGNRKLAVRDDRINQKSESSGASVNIDYDLGWATLTSISAWREWEIDEFNEADGLSNTNVNNRNGTQSSSEQFTQEFRLSGSAMDRVDYVAGLYYFDQELDADGTVFIELALPFPPFFNAATNAVRDVATESFAAFGEATFHATDRLALILGARYTDEEVSANYNRTASAIIPTLPFASFFGPDVAGSETVSDTDISGRAIARYTVSDSLTTYITASRGYKGVGIDVAESVNIAAIETPGGLPTLAPEIPTLYELGVKSEFLDGSLSMNTAIFYQTVEDLQSITSDDQGRTLNLSIDEVLSKGVEVDAYFRSRALPGLSLAAALTYLDVTIEEFQGNTGLEGQPFPGVPELAWSLIADYSFDVGSSGYEAFVRGEYYWQDEKNTALDGNPLRTEDSYGLLNIRAGITSPAGKYSLTLAAENVADEEYASFVGGSSYSAIDGVTTTQYVGDPLTYRLILAAKF